MGKLSAQKRLYRAPGAWRADDDTDQLKRLTRAELLRIISKLEKQTPINVRGTGIESIWRLTHGWGHVRKPAFERNHHRMHRLPVRRRALHRRWRDSSPLLRTASFAALLSFAAALGLSRWERPSRQRER